jgi:hypothetical protein
MKKIKALFSPLLLVFLLLFLITSSYAEGKFSLKIVHDGNKANEKLARYMEKKGTFRKIVKALNETLTIPYNIKIIMTSSKIGPYYSPSKKEIILDYNDELWAAKQYDKNYPDSDKETRNYYLNNINLGSLYHELGHALIDAYNIPMVAQEEDAADSLSAVLILYYFTEGPQIILDNADYYYTSSQSRGDDGPEANDYWDEHPLDEQRYYRFLCYAYAKDPEYVAEQFKEMDKENEDDTLSKFLKAKKDSCIWEYKNLNQSWFSILKPHFKDGSEADDAIDEINNAESEEEEDDDDDGEDDSDSSDDDSDDEDEDSESN